MADFPSTTTDMARQLRLHLQSLKEAGVEWLPLAVQMETDVPSGCDVPSDCDEPRSPDLVEDAELTDFGELFLDAAGPQLTREQRRVELDLLTERVAGCTRCAELLSTRSQTVFGEGPLDADLCVIGEAPGFQEDQQGRPFVGDAGHLLDRILNACGFERREVYICNILKCRPPGNRTPLANEASNCREYLDRQLELVKPKYICAMGACAAQNLLGTTQSISRLRRRFHDYDGIAVMCTYHPAYLLRTPEKKRDVWEDMKMLLNHMGRPVPQR